MPNSFSASCDRNDFIERVVEVPFTTYKKKIVEKIREVPRRVVKERIVEVPEIQYKEVPVERIVEVEEIKKVYVKREVPVPQYVERIVEEVVEVESSTTLTRHIPCPLLHSTKVDIAVPQLTAQRRVVRVPIKVPRFVEVPVPEQLLEPELRQQVEELRAKVGMATQGDVSLTSISEAASYARAAQFTSRIREKDFAAAWQEYVAAGGCASR